MTLREHETADLTTPRGVMRTHLLRPAAEGRYPGIVLWSEIYQVTAPVRRTAALLAGHGFVVSVPEIWHDFEAPGVVMNYDAADTEKGNHYKISKELASYDDDASAAVAHLKSHAACTGNIGTVGICIGGHLATRAAFLPDVKAGVCFYATDIHKRSLAKGMNDDTIDRLGEIGGEMLYVWGRQDPHVPADGRRLVQDALTAVGVNFAWHEVNGQHAFLRDEGLRYDAALAVTCYGMALELLQRVLR